MFKLVPPTKKIMIKQGMLGYEMLINAEASSRNIVRRCEMTELQLIVLITKHKTFGTWTKKPINYSDSHKHTK